MKTFVTHEGIVKHSVAQFRDMMSDNHRIEYNYIQSFQTVVANVERMPPHQPGDVQFVVDCAGVVTMELKLCCLDRRSNFECLLYNKKHDMRDWVNRVSVFGCVILESEDIPLSEKRCNPEVFK